MIDFPIETAYRKRPIVISAVQWDGSGFVGGSPAWVFLAVDKKLLVPEKPALKVLVGPDEGFETPPSYDTAQPGDWIIRGVAGEIYRCPKLIFEATYEKASP